MSSDALRNSLLEARDRRQAQLESFAPHAECLIFLSLNLPGEKKTGQRPQRLFDWALIRLSQEVPVELLHIGCDALGPYALYRSPLTPREAKERAVALEAIGRGGRLVDIDVYDTSARALGRGALGLPPRVCLLCGHPAVECMRLKRHETGLLQEEVDAIIDAL